MATIASLVVNIGADISDIQRNTERAASSVEGMASKVSTAMKVMATSFVVTEVVDFVGTIINAADALDKLSGQLAETATNVQRLQTAAIATDTEIGALTTGVQALDAALGSGKAADGLAKINLTVAQLRALSPVEAYIAFAEALARVSDRGTQLAIAQEIGIKNAKALASTFRDDLGKAAEPWIKASDEGVAALANLETGFGKVTQSAKNFGIELLANVSGLKAYQLAIKDVDDEQARWFEHFNARNFGDMGDIQLKAPPRADRPDVGFEPGLIEGLNAKYREGQAFLQGQATDVARIADGWLAVWERVKEINAEYRVALTLEGEQINNAIQMNFLKRQQTEQQIRDLEQTFNPATAPDRVGEIIARADAEAAQVTGPGAEQTIAEIYRRANLEIAIMNSELGKAIDNTNKVAEGAARVHDEFQRAAAGAGHSGGYVDDRGRPTTELRSAVLANMPASTRPQSTAIFGAGGEGFVFNTTINGALASDEDALRRMIERLLMEQVSQGPLRPGAR